MILFNRHNFDFQQFLRDYLATAAWASVEPSECQEFTEEAKQQAAQDCMLFIGFVIGIFGEEKGMQVLKTPANDLGYLAAHDFFLTRCGHGSGFWDKEDQYGRSAATRLTAISNTIGSVDVGHVAGPKSKLTFD